MDIMDIYRNTFKKYSLQSYVNITLSNNNIEIAAEDSMIDADTLGACLEEALSDANVYAKTYMCFKDDKLLATDEDIIEMK